MNTELIWQLKSIGPENTSRLGELLGSNLAGAAVIELISDLGGGKTTLTQGLARGLGSKDIVSSPTFTLSKIYKAKGDIEIHHYDFYRLNDPGILRDELAESLADKKVVTIIEWSGIVVDVLPEERLAIQLKPTATGPDEREITIKYGDKYIGLIEKLKTAWTEVQP